MSARRPPPRGWVGPDPAAACGPLSPKELESVRAKARRDLVRGARPARGRPHLILTVGAPGAGKSTVAPLVAAARAPGESYVTVDFDLAFRYHPRYRDVWDIPSAADGRPTGVGAALGFLFCGEHIEPVYCQLLAELMGGGARGARGARHNIILQSHSRRHLVSAQRAGYRTTLLYVQAPLAVAQARSRARAAATGMFLAPTLRAQDVLVAQMWAEYRALAPWAALWADEFVVADNGASRAPGAPPPFRVVPVRPPGCGADWAAPALKAEKALASAAKPQKEKKPRPPARAAPKAGG